MTTLVCLLALGASQQTADHGPLARLLPLGAKVSPVKGGLEFVVTMNANADLPDQEIELKPVGAASPIMINLAKADYLDGELSANFTMTAPGYDLAGIRVDCVRIVETYTDVNGSDSKRVQTPNQGTPLFVADIASGESRKLRLATRGMSFAPESQSIEVVFAVNGFWKQSEYKTPVAEALTVLNVDGVGAILAAFPPDVTRINTANGERQTLFTDGSVASLAYRREGFWALTNSGQIQHRGRDGALGQALASDQKFSIGPVVDGRGFAYFVSGDGLEVHRFGPDGADQGKTMTVNPITGLDVDHDGTLYATTRVGILKAGIGRVFGPITAGGTQMGLLSKGTSVKVDRKRGIVYVVENLSDKARLSAFDREGAFATSFRFGGPSDAFKPQAAVVLPDSRLGLLEQGAKGGIFRIYAPL